MSSVPGGKGLSLLMKTPPLLRSAEYCSMNSSTVALLNRTLRETGALLLFRTSSTMTVDPPVFRYLTGFHGEWVNNNRSISL